MSLIRYEPYSLLDQLQNEFFRSALANREVTDDSSNIEVCDWRPAVDIREEKERYVIHADLPGVEAKDIEVTLENGILTLKGERARDQEELHEGYKKLERVRGTFYRRFSLPDTADINRIEAKSRDGVLEIVVPKQEKVQPRKITVNS